MKIQTKIRAGLMAVPIDGDPPPPPPPPRGRGRCC
jgi:hypothetical protein